MIYYLFITGIVFLIFTSVQAQEIEEVDTKKTGPRNHGNRPIDVLKNLLNYDLFPSRVLFHVRINRSYAVGIGEPLMFPCLETYSFACVRF